MAQPAGVNIAIVVKDMTFNLNVSNEGKISLPDSGIPKIVTEDALKSLKKTMDELKTHLKTKQFRTIEHQDENVEILSTIIRTQMKAKTFFDSLTEKVKEKKPKEIIASLNDLNINIDEKIQELADYKNYCKKVEMKLDKLNTQLQNRTPLSIDSSGLKIDQIGEDITRSISQNEFQLKFLGQTNITKNADLKLDATKIHTHAMIRNTFKACYGSDFDEKILDKLIGQVKSQKDMTITAEEIRSYKKDHKSDLQDDQIRQFIFFDKIKNFVDSQTDVKLSNDQKRLYTMLAYTETLIDNQPDVTKVGLKLQQFILGDLADNTRDKSLAISTDPRDKAAAWVLFAIMSQEIKNNLSEPFQTLKSMLKNDPDVKIIPRPNSHCPLQDVKISIKDNGNIVVKRTIDYADNYKPEFSLEINPKKGRIENFDLKREVAVIPSDDEAENEDNENKAQRIEEAFNNIEGKYDVKFGVTHEVTTRTQTSTSSTASTSSSPVGTPPLAQATHPIHQKLVIGEKRPPLTDKPTNIPLPTSSTASTTSTTTVKDAEKPPKAEATSRVNRHPKVVLGEKRQFKPTIAKTEAQTASTASTSSTSSAVGKPPETGKEQTIVVRNKILRKSSTKNKPTESETGSTSTSAAVGKPPEEGTEQTIIVRNKILRKSSTKNKPIESETESTEE